MFYYNTALTVQIKSSVLLDCIGIDTSDSISTPLCNYFLWDCVIPNYKQTSISSIIQLLHQI